MSVSFVFCTNSDNVLHVSRRETWQGVCDEMDNVIGRIAQADGPNLGHYEYDQRELFNTEKCAFAWKSIEQLLEEEERFTLQQLAEDFPEALLEALREMDL